MDLSELKSSLGRLPLPMKKIRHLEKGRRYEVTKIIEVNRGPLRSMVITIENEFDILLPPKASMKMEENCSVFLKLMLTNARCSRVYILYQGRNKFNFEGIFVCNKLKIE